MSPSKVNWAQDRLNGNQEDMAAIGSLGTNPAGADVLGSVSSAYDQASSMMLGAAQSVASGNLDNFPNDATTMIMAETMASAATDVALVSQEMTSSLLDIRV